MFRHRFSALLIWPDAVSAGALQRREVTFKVFQFPAGPDSIASMAIRMIGRWCPTVLDRHWTNGGYGSPGGHGTNRDLESK